MEVSTARKAKIPYCLFREDYKKHIHRLLKTKQGQKRYSGGDLLLSELEDCIPSRNTVWGEMENKALSRLISDWLNTLPKEDRILFVRRYWYGDSVKELASAIGMTPSKLASRMYRLRSNLKDFLEKEEVTL